MAITPQEAERLQFAIEAAKIGFWEVDLNDNRLKWDSRCKEIFGLPVDDDRTYKEAIQQIHPDDRLRVSQAIDKALSGQNNGTYDARYRTIGAVDGTLRWVHFSGQAYFDGKGKAIRFGGIAQDATAIQTAVHETERNLLESEDRFRSIFEQAPLAIGLLSGRDMVVEAGNESLFTLWGKDASVVGLPILQALPEISEQGFLEILQRVYDTGEPFQGNGILIRLVRNGQLSNAFFDFTYTPVRTRGEISGVLVLAIEVTPQVQAQQSLAASEAKLRDVIEAAPAGMVLFTGKDLVVEMPNQAFMDMAGRGRELTGKPLREAMPELNTQAFMKLIEDVYNTGKRYENVLQADIIEHGVLVPHYYNFSYTPLFNAAGEVYSVLDISVDVTEEMNTRKRMEESEASLRGAVELAELGTWVIDIPTQQMTCSPRLFDWFGVDPRGAGIETMVRVLIEKDRDRIKQAFSRAMQEGSDGIYDEEYTIVHPVTGQRRVLHAQGKTLFNEQGIPIKMVGSAQDITVHRELQLTLEMEIQQRTEELDVTNEELQAANEELSSTNEELAELNENLLSSNQDLQQFAHVASHDLKEPLRKVKIFLSRLEDDVSNTISARSRAFIEKMNISTNRMFSMIEGVLSYSKLNSEEQFLQPVNINEIIASIIVDLEVPISQTNADVDYKDLPTIDGAFILIYQLFYNLIVNSLKFSRENAPAHIKISSTFAERKKERFCRIEVSDNGIGFDDKYADKIFGTFIRLNPKDKYEGTGLGLALCRKIVQRHNGTIEAQGRLGEGATFIIWLPIKHLYPSI